MAKVEKWYFQGKVDRDTHPFIATFVITGIENSGVGLDPCSYLVTHTRLSFSVLYYHLKVRHRMMKSTLHSLVQNRHPVAPPRLLFTTCSHMVLWIAASYSREIVSPPA